MPKGSRPLADRLWSQVGPPDDNGCRPFVGRSRTPSGRGRVKTDDGAYKTAHLVAWAVTNGPIPAGLKVRHRCGNGECCEPTHLYLDTQRDNIVRGADHPYWKGADASYSAVHVWARRHLPKPPDCQHCGRTDRPLDWANISGQYLRVAADWIALCKRCHREFDRKPTCRKGHPRTPENTIIDYRGLKKCRVCVRETNYRRYYERQGRTAPPRVPR